MAERSTFLVHLTSDDSVWIEVVATGEVVSVANLDLVGAAIERCRSERHPSEHHPSERHPSDRAAIEDSGVEG